MARSSTYRCGSAGQCEAPSLAGEVGGDSRRGGRPVDREVVRPGASAQSTRQQQRCLAGPPADGLACGDHRHEHGATTDQCEGAAAADRRGSGFGSGPVRRVRMARVGCLRVGVQHVSHRHRPQARPHAGNLDGDVDHEARDEDPGAVVVGRVEAEAEDVVVLDVQDAGDDLEQDPADEHQQRDAFEHLRDRPRRWPREQPRDHRPQFRQHDRDQDQPQSDVQTLIEPVQPRRVGRPVERRQLEPADVARYRLAELRPVRDIGQQPGDRHDRQGDQAAPTPGRMSTTGRAAGCANALRVAVQAVGAVQPAPQPPWESVSARVGRRRSGGSPSAIAPESRVTTAMVCAWAASVTNSSGSGGSTAAPRRR